MAAALATIDYMQHSRYIEHIWGIGAQMHTGLESILMDLGLKQVAEVVGLPPHCGLIFNGLGALSYLEVMTLFQQTMIEAGILTVGINNLAMAHSSKDVEDYLAAAKGGFSLIAEAAKAGSIEGLLRGNIVDPIFKR